MRSLITWWFNLDPNTFGSDAEWSVRLNQALEGWQVFLLAAAVIAFAVWIYRRDGRGTASLRLRVLLGFLRACLLGLVIFILTEPLLIATHVETRPSTVLLLVDNSFSMDLGFGDAQEELRRKLRAGMGNAALVFPTENGKTETVNVDKLQPRHWKALSRLDAISAALRATDPQGEDFMQALAARHTVRLYGFARELADKNEDGKELTPATLQSSSRYGGETRLGDCLRRALKEMRGQPVAGIIVISDGRQNAGEDAVVAAQACRTQRVPLFVVGVGDPTEPKDFEVTFEGPEMILPDDQTEGIAYVRYKGYTDVGSIQIEMKNGDKVIASENVKLGKPGEKTAVPLRFKESKPGKYTYQIRVPEQEGELRADNNVCKYIFQVVDKKVRVLFVEGQDLPRWEYRYLKNALRRDHTTECDVLLATGEGTETGFLWDGTDGKTPLEHFPINKKEINEYDVLIFGDVNPVVFTSEQMTLVRDFVREGGGFIMIAGERFAPAEYVQGPWAEMLPVVPQRAAYQAPDGGFQEYFPLELSPEGRKLAWTHFDTDEAINRDIWDNLPRLLWYYPVRKKKELATTIAVHPFDKDETGAKMPLVVTMPYGSGRTMFIGVDSLWRWRRGIGDRYHYRFYSQAIRYLSMAKRLGGQKRFYLGTDRNVVAIGDPVTLTAVLRDENFKELNTERATVHGKTPKGEDFLCDLRLLRDRPGNYEGPYIPTMQGEYTFWLKDDGQPDVHQSEVSLKVEKPQLEYENPKLDEELLQNVAKSGGEGGAYFPFERIRELPAGIQPREEKMPRESSISLWDNWLVFLLFAGLITLEWVLRKKGQMV